MEREVWISHEAIINVWELDASGNVVTPALRTETYVQNVSCRPVRFVSTNRQPGVAFEESVSRVIGHEIRIGKLHSKKSAEITPFESNNGKKYRVLLELINPRYTGVAPLENDSHDYRGCEVTDGPGIKFDDDGVVETDIVFKAERKL